MPVSMPRPSMLDRRVTELGGKTTVTVLVACGDALRRPADTASARPEETERALGALSLAEVTAALEGVEAASCRVALARATEDAFEAVFADTAEDRTLFASSALDGLQERDRIESLRVAAHRRAALATDGAGSGVPSSAPSGRDGELAAITAALARLEREIVSIDGNRIAHCRKLTGVNRERRAERDRLSADARVVAWWFTDRADADQDGLLLALGGAAPGDAATSAAGSLPGGADEPVPGRWPTAVEADLQASRLPTCSDLIEKALAHVARGNETPGERELLTKRASVDASVRSALTLAEDRSIEADALVEER